MRTYFPLNHSDGSFEAEETHIDVVMSGVLTKRGEVRVLGAEQEKIHPDLLPRAVEGEFLIEVCGGAEVLNSLRGNKRTTPLQKEILRLRFLLCRRRDGEHRFREDPPQSLLTYRTVCPLNDSM